MPDTVFDELLCKGFVTVFSSAFDGSWLEFPVGDLLEDHTFGTIFAESMILRTGHCNTICDEGLAKTEGALEVESSESLFSLFFFGSTHILDEFVISFHLVSFNNFLPNNLGVLLKLYYPLTSLTLQIYHQHLHNLILTSGSNVSPDIVLALFSKHFLCTTCWQNKGSPPPALWQITHLMYPSN